MNPVCGKPERSEPSNRAAGRWCELKPEQEPGWLTGSEGCWFGQEKQTVAEEREEESLFDKPPPHPCFCYHYLCLELG